MDEKLKEIKDKLEVAKDAAEVAKGTVEVAGAFASVVKWIAEEKPFGVVHKTAPIKYAGELGVLVWDYILWNELTFVDNATKSKQSIFTSISDKETSKKFDELVGKYGV